MVFPSRPTGGTERPQISIEWIKEGLESSKTLSFCVGWSFLTKIPKYTHISVFFGKIKLVLPYIGPFSNNTGEVSKRPHINLLNTEEHLCKNIIWSFAGRKMVFMQYFKDTRYYCFNLSTKKCPFTFYSLFLLSSPWFFIYSPCFFREEKWILVRKSICYDETQ